MTTTANDIQVLRRIANAGGIRMDEMGNGRGAQFRATTVSRLHDLGLLERGPRPRDWEVKYGAGPGSYVTVKGFAAIAAAKEV